jgi:hypothetical protein
MRRLQKGTMDLGRNAEALFRIISVVGCSIGANMRITFNASVILTAASCLFAADARANLLTNGSFENTGGTFVGDVNKVDELLSGSSAIPGWTTTNGTQTAWIENGNPWNISASDGSFFLDLTGYSDSGTYGGVTQTFATSPGTSYTLTFDLGYGGNSTAFGGPVSVQVTAGGSSGTFTSGSGVPNPALWDPETFNFTASSSTTQVTIIGLSTTGGDYIGIDDADVELGTAGTVPEPGSFYLLGSVLVAVAIVRYGRTGRTN